VELLGIDYAIVLIYLAGISLVGVLLSRAVKSSKDYFLAGRFLPFWAIGMSIVVTDIGATDMIGLAGQAYRYGVAAANFDWIGSFPAMILAAFIFIPYYWRSGVYTIPEFLGRRYNEAVRVTMSAIWIALLALDVGAVFYASAIFLQELMGWEYWTSACVTAGVIGVYTVSGGLAAVVLTDAAQLVIMFTGCIAILALGFWEVGGWGGMVEKIQALGPEYAHHFDLLLPADAPTPYPWPGILFGLGLVMASAYFVGNQNIVQRTLGAKNEWHAKASMLFGAFLKALIPVLVATPGLIALAYYGGALEDGDTAFPKLIRDLLPPGMRGLMFAAFMAAMMSSIDSVLNSSATLWTKDIWQRWIRPRSTDRQLLRMGRVFTIVLLVIGVATSRLSTHFDGLYVFLQTLFSIVQGPSLAILLLGIFWRRATAAGGLAGLLVGVASALLMTWQQKALFSIEDPFLYVSLWSFVVGLGVTWSVSLLTRPHDEQRLYGLVYGMVMHDDEAQDALRRRADG
jgi:SSS family solute:Na+ symporter